MKPLENTTREEIKRNLRGRSIANLESLLEFNRKFREITSLRVEIIEELLDEMKPDFKLRQSNGN